MHDNAATLRPRRVVAILLLVLPTACIFSSVRVAPLSNADAHAPATVRTPVKAHLIDGGTVVYASGVGFRNDSLIGAGMLYDLTLQNRVMVTGLPLSRVAAMEVYSTHVDQAATIIGSTLAGAIAMGTAAAVAKALFGSCPTIYADTGGAFALQGEAFSSSVVPLFEARDVDVLRIGPDADGLLALQIRNEALETHYINFLELLEVRHAADEIVLPDVTNRPLVLAGLVEPASVRDRGGDDRRRETARLDGRVFTRSSVPDDATTGSVDDHLDLVLPRPEADSVAVVFRMRNSLLNTVLLYDVLLGGRGAGALDWVGEDMNRIGEAAALGQWYATRLGIHVSVMDGGTWRPSGRVPDAGPIAWKDVALIVQVPHEGDSLRIRLSFVADAWRIDQLRVATRVRRPEVRTIPPAWVREPRGLSDSALQAIRDPDGRYLETMPTDRITVGWETGPAAPPGTATYLIAAQGYYIEWIRQEWLRRAPVTAGPPSDELLHHALAEWRVRRADYERRFEATRIGER